MFDVIESADRMQKFYEVGYYWEEDRGSLLSGMVMEEAAELIQAINKLDRRTTPEHWQNVKDEIGDLIIILEAYVAVFNISSDDILARIDQKLAMKKES